ncbi:hypothetical protein ABIB44_000144 [Hymenobacter sp. UYCo722]
MDFVGGIQCSSSKKACQLASLFDLIQTIIAYKIREIR